MFAPAVLDVPTKRAVKEPEPARATRKKLVNGAIELELGGATVRIASGADAAAIAAGDPGPEGNIVIGPSGAVKVMVAPLSYLD